MKLKHLVFLLLMLASVSTVFGYNWACYDRGESLPSGTACGSDCCVACLNNGWTTLPQNCNSNDQCSCDGVTPPPIEPASVNVVSPLNGQVYYANRVTLDVQLNKVVTSIKYKMDTGADTVVCTNCQQTGQVLVPSTTLADGSHTLIVKIFEGATITSTATVTFETDMTAPVIVSTSPNTGLIDDDTFKVTYTEQHVAEVKLFYRKTGEASYSEKLFSCTSGTAKECSGKADLSPYEINDTVEYYFKVKDGARETASAAKTVTINKDFEPCAENWSCSGWTTCSASQQTRTCNDLNSCGTQNNKPALTQSCTMPSTGGSGGSSGGSSGGRSSGGGGGGGGGGSGGSSVVPKGVSYSKLWPTLKPEEQEVNINKDGLDVVKFSFKAKSAKSNSKLQITALEKKPVSLPDPEGNLYQHIQVDHTGLENSDLDGVITFQFKVNKTWFMDNEIDPESVVLQRYNGGKWNELSTKRIGEDDDYYYYEAESPGMSNFAITAEKAEEPAVKEEVKTENTAGTAETPEAAEEATKETQDDTTNTNAITGNVAADSVTIPIGTIKMVLGTLVLIGFVAGLFFVFEKMKN